MKNKKFLALIAFICLFTTVGYANNFMISGLGFVAPSIIGKSNIYNPQIGEIVYDQSDATFYGYDHNGQWQSLNGSSGGSVPSGTILPFGGTVAPSGYLLCDGQSYSQALYGNLHAAIGNAFGGDSTNFNVPDLRGRFLRGADDGAGNDPGATTRTAMAPGGNSGDQVGSIQGDEFKSHNHDLRISSTTSSGTNVPTLSNSLAGGNGTQVTSLQFVVPEGGNETRPKNASVNYIIKI